jgi:membrane protein DedA with SNARE-associated domain
MEWMYHIIRHLLVSWGYWAVLLGLLAENAGVPVPGETILMFSSFLAHKTSQLSIVWVIVAGTVAAIGGDNLGFLLGRWLRGTLIRWMKKIFRMDDEDVGAARNLIRRHGAATVFWARYIFGLRTIAGPLAGMLGMPWKRFLLFNALGAASWVTAMALVGYTFANEFQSLLGYFEKASWAFAGGLFALGYYLWHRQKKKFEQQQPEHKAA